MTSHSPGGSPLPVLNHLLLMISFLAIGALVIFPVHDPDTFWHLANGRASLETRRIIQEEIFSFSAAGAPFTNHEWLSQIFLYLAYRLGGPDGLIALKLALTFGYAWLLRMVMLRRDVPGEMAAALCLVAVVVGYTRFTVRPQLFSYLFLALLSLILYSFRSGRSSRRILWWIPPLMLFWDTLHEAIYGLQPSSPPRR